MEKRISIKRRAICVFSFVMITIFFGGCEPDPNEYHLDYPEAYTMAVYSLLGENGGRSSYIDVLEKDDYGRQLYYYVAPGLISDSKYTWSVLVSQKIEERSVFYYPDYNFVIFFHEVDLLTGDTNTYIRDVISASVSEEAMNLLKSQNDWGKELDEDKCIEQKILRKKKDISRRIVGRNIIERVYTQLFPTKKYDSYQCAYLMSDDYRRHIYFFLGMDFDGRNAVGSYVVMFYPDGTYDEATGIQEITDLCNYQDELREFKERNHWNEPVS